MALDPAAVAKYGMAGARRRAQRQGIGVSDIRRLTPQQLQQYRQGGSGITKGLGFNFGAGPRAKNNDFLRRHGILNAPPGVNATDLPTYRAMHPGASIDDYKNYVRGLASKGGPAGGRPQLEQLIAQKRRRKGGPAGGRPYLP